MPRKPFTLIPMKMEAVIQAAFKEFSRYGYSHASTNRICAKSGVSKGALFHNFHSKENLFYFLVQDGLRLAEREFKDHFSAQDRAAPFQEIFRNSFFVLLNFIKRYPDYYNIYLRLIYDPDIPERERKKVTEVVRIFTVSISDALFQEGRKRRIFPANLDENIAKFLFNTLITRFVELYYFPLRDPGLDVSRKTESELGETLDTLCRLLISGLAARR